MTDKFSVGDRIGDYCNGFFGRDDYEDKTCILVTYNYAVFVHDTEGTATVLNRVYCYDSLPEGKFSPEDKNWKNWRHSDNRNWDEN